MKTGWLWVFLFCFFFHFTFYYYHYLPLFFFYHNKIHPVTNNKAIKNKINKARQHRTFF